MGRTTVELRLWKEALLQGCHWGRKKWQIPNTPTLTTHHWNSQRQEQSTPCVLNSVIGSEKARKSIPLIRSELIELPNKWLNRRGHSSWTHDPLLHKKFRSTHIRYITLDSPQWPRFQHFYLCDNFMIWPLFLPWKSLGAVCIAVFITTETGGHFFEYDGHCSETIIIRSASPSTLSFRRSVQSMTGRSEYSKYCLIHLSISIDGMAGNWVGVVASQWGFLIKR